MPQPYKGRRQAVTVRLPTHLYAAVAEGARLRRWTMNQFMVYAAERATGSRPAATVKSTESAPTREIDLEHLNV